MALIRPRLNDYHNILLLQQEVDFAIPFLDEDLPLYADPFLLWKSPSQQDQSLHMAMISAFNYLGYLCGKGNEADAIQALLTASECNEVGLGLSKIGRGRRITKNTAGEILSLFKSIPDYNNNGFNHIEVMQLYVDQISKDRISDFFCNFVKSFLIDFTIEQCERLKLPVIKIKVEAVYSLQKKKFSEEEVYLPVNPLTNTPIILVPKRWLRHVPWINFEDYFKNHCPSEKIIVDDNPPSRIAILNFNRSNYGIINAYVEHKEHMQNDCKNDPLFKSIPVLSAKRTLSTIKKLPSGKAENADKKYEDNVCKLLASVLYPHLDFAVEQSRTDSGVLIRDLIFYNNQQLDFLKEIYNKFNSCQLVFEIKNVQSIEREHINQLNRYLNNEIIGSFGIIVTRNKFNKAMFRNTIDLWAGQRKCIISVTDDDIDLMVSLYESKQRLPIEVIKKKYLEFIRSCPS